MALVQCKECGQMISGKARTCPQCGAPRYVARLKQGFFFLFLEIAIVVVVLTWVLWSTGVIKIGVH